MKTQASCFGWFSHYEALIENFQKLLDLAAVSLTFHALDKGLIMA
jgi:hypothetical protein